MYMIKLTRGLEEYLEVLYKLKLKGKKVFRISEIARMTNVSMASVSSAIKRLHELGMVKYERYGYVELTKAGEKYAKKMYESEILIFKFLHEILGVSKNVALEDACKIEHDLSNETLEKLEKFIRKILGGNK
ncbi:metal-dependent transcriptional regulator [archaeon]|nr:MAG: metal-dependent transcriptional regulator [archaeon]RLG64311.1 MAG: metal-dependent transcriptional regulator [archaeon]RLG66271.1 MAG: metal-dependent transcriptional regulator [archaeon]HDM24195.1 metal-dependent transcriptional regulator [Candidatus Bathyarchaeota archaeon]